MDLFIYWLISCKSLIKADNQNGGLKVIKSAMAHGTSNRYDFKMEWRWNISWLINRHETTDKELENYCWSATTLFYQNIATNIFCCHEQTTSTIILYTQII